MDVRGSRVGEAGFGLFEVGGNFAKLVDFHVGPGLDEFETLPDGHAAATGFTSNARGVESIDAIEAKDGEGGRASARPLSVELLDEGEGAGGNAFFCIARLGGEFRKKLAGNSSARKAKRGVGSESDGGIERKERGVGTGEKFEGNCVHVFCGGREEDESPAQSGNQFEQDGAKPGSFLLDGQDNGDGVNGPRADLASVEQAKIGGFMVEGEDVAERAGNFVPTEFKEHDVLGCQRNVGTVWRVATADGANS